MPTVSISKSRVTTLHSPENQSEAQFLQCPDAFCCPMHSQNPSFWKGTLKVGQKTGERRAYCYEQIRD